MLGCVQRNTDWGQNGPLIWSIQDLYIFLYDLVILHVLSSCCLDICCAMHLGRCTVHTDKTAVPLFISLPSIWEKGFQGSTSGQEPACQCRRHKRSMFDPWVRKIPWRNWQPTPVFLPGEFHRQRSLEGYSPWGCKELDTTEWLTHTHTHMFGGKDRNNLKMFMQIVMTAVKENCMVL